MALLLTDEDLPRLLTVSDAIKAVRAALREHQAGTATGLAMSPLPAGQGQLELSGGALAKQGRAGFRGRPRGAAGTTDVVAVWDSGRGELDGLVLGAALGLLRDAALGGIALQALAPETVTKVALLGPGARARAQLQALLTVRQPEWVELHLPEGGEVLARAAAELRDALGIPVTPAASAETAVRGADVILAVGDPTPPALQAAWVGRGTHVTLCGALQLERGQPDPVLLARCEVLVSDAPAVLRGLGLSSADKLRELASLLTGSVTREPDDATVFLLHGLAGTEVALAAAAISRARAMGLGVPLPGLPEV